MINNEYTPFSPVTILLVDDTPANLHILSKMLADKGYKVRAVTDGQLAINSAQASPPDLILLDINMPDMDGYETCRRLKSSEKTAEIPVICVSAMGETEDKVRAFEVGGIDYITKPFQVDEVLARVRIHITIHHLQNQLQKANEKMKADVEALKQMEHSEHEQRMLAETLRDITTTINCDLDLEKVLDMIIFGIGQVVEHDVVNITLVDETGIARIVRQIGYDKYMSRDQFYQVQLSVNDTSTLQRMVNTGQGLIISNTETNDIWITPPGEEWIKSYMGAPILVRGKVVGFINLDSSIPNFYTPDKAENLLIFATQAGIAIENARLYTEAQRRVKELSILNQISLLISSTTNLEKVTDLVYQQVNRLIDTQFFMIATVEPEKNEWRTIYLKRYGQRIENFHISMDEGFAGFVLQTQQPLYLADKKAIDDFITKTGRESLISIPRSIMLVPLIFSNRVIGVIGVQHDDKENAYSKDDYALFNSIGAQVAIWIENANLFAGMEKLAVTDTLTGIYNRRQLFNLAQQELERAYRYNRDFSLAMIDIDHFKTVNDRFGHPVGDEVLKAFTRLCVENLRLADIIGRYGGEEFLILMPETDHTRAMDASERLRVKIEKMKVQFENGYVTVTASIGIVSLNSIWSKGNRKPSLDQLIRHADEALYQAKANGRNRVCG
jgi:diguanylate cyclase (GGDEF)-like protein